ncbi:MAG: family 78 glycoside hydrolase catalytic domain, partial [Bacteroidales bacterium]
MIHRTFYLLILILGFSLTAGTTTREPFTHSRWITSPLAGPSHDSLRFEEQSTSLFKKCFPLDEKPHHATLYITAAGYYAVQVNGHLLPQYRLDPAWTDFSKRVYYRSVDIAQYLVKGQNTVVVEVAPGFYDPLPLKMWGHLNLREHLPTGPPSFIAALYCSSQKTDTLITSDSSWSFRKGAVFKSSVYLGEWVDRRRIDSAWMTSGRQAPDELKARTWDGPGGALEPAEFPAVQITQTLQPKEIWKISENRWILDFGTNLTGAVRFNGPTNPGDTLIFRYGERIYPDSTLNAMTAAAGQIKRAGVGGKGAPAVAEQVDGVISEGGLILFEPWFTYHVFRYVEVAGLSFNPDPKWFTALHLHTAVNPAGHFESDKPWLGDLQQMITQTFTSNLVGVQSDCPAREKFGYGGDLNATAESYLYFFDMREFYRKTLFDWQDAMKDDRFVDTAPFVGIQYCGLSWESAFLLIQEKLFEFYRDTALVQEWYEENLRWIEKVERLHPDGWITAGLSDHESLKPVPAELIQNTHLFAVYRTMETMATVMADDRKILEFKKKTQDIRNRLVDSLWLDPARTVQNPQTWYAALLYYDLLNPAQAAQAVDSLVKGVREAGGGLTTGIFGTQYILEALSKYGHFDLAYQIVKREEFPGWRFMMNRGATTLWETWKESDNTFSQNHP